MSVISNSSQIVMETMHWNSINLKLLLSLEQNETFKNQLTQATITINELQQQVQKLKAQIQTQEKKLETMVQIIYQIDGQITNFLNNSHFNTINFIQFQAIEREKIISLDKSITQIQTNFDLFIKQLEIHFPITRARTIWKIEQVKSANEGQKKLEKMTDQSRNASQKQYLYSKTQPCKFFPN